MRRVLCYSSMKQLLSKSNVLCRFKKKTKQATTSIIISFEHSSVNSSKNPELRVKRKKHKTVSHKHKYMEAAGELARRNTNNALFHQLFTTTHGETHRTYCVPHELAAQLSGTHTAN